MKKNISFAVNTYNQAKILIAEAKKRKMKPVIYIKFYLISGFGIEWLESFDSMLKKIFGNKSFELYVDSKNDYGICLELINFKVNYININTNNVILNKIEQIAKKNKVLLNPSFRIVDLSNIKNLKKKFNMNMSK